MKLPNLLSYVLMIITSHISFFLRRFLINFSVILTIKLIYSSTLLVSFPRLKMATLRNKRRLTGINRENHEQHPRNSQARGTNVSLEFSRTDNRILGALSKLDEFRLNPQVRVDSGSVLETSRISCRENQEATGDRSQNDSSFWSEGLSESIFKRLLPRRCLQQQHTKFLWFIRLGAQQNWNGKNDVLNLVQKFDFYDFWKTEHLKSLSLSTENQELCFYLFLVNCNFGAWKR